MDDGERGLEMEWRKRRDAAACVSSRREGAREREQEEREQEKREQEKRRDVNGG